MINNMEKDNIQIKMEQSNMDCGIMEQEFNGWIHKIPVKIDSFYKLFYNLLIISINFKYFKFYNFN